MAKYAQGYERKNSDSKNLIIMISIIIAAVVLAIGFMVLYNNFLRKDEVTFASSEYSEYFLEADDDLLYQNMSQKDTGGNYYIYVCSKSGTSDTNMELILEYIDKTNSDSSLKKLFLLDYDEFDDSDDDDEEEVAAEVEEALNYTISASGCLIEVKDYELTNPSNQVITKAKTVKSTIKGLLK